MSNKKRSRQHNGALTRTILLAILLVVAAAGAAAVMFFRTTRGRVVLMDLGVTTQYGVVQQALDDDLREVLHELDLDDDLTERTSAVIVGDRSFLTREWRVTCDAEASLVRINIEVSRCVRSNGATVRSSFENAEGQLLVFDIGSRRFPTHKIAVNRAVENVDVDKPDTARPKLALVIDDFGYTKSDLVEAFLTMEMPLTIAVIPSLRYSSYAVSRAQEMSKEAILHLPMEAEAYQSDVDAVTTSMSRDEIVDLLHDYLVNSPGVTGINNHLGSKATQDPLIMNAVLTVVKSNDLYFLDSLTSPKSVGFETAQSMGVRAARNDVFLDWETEDQAVVEKRLQRLVRIAKQRGYAIGIGHPKEWTYGAIMAKKDVFDASGVDLVLVSDLVE